MSRLLLLPVRRACFLATGILVRDASRKEARQLVLKPYCGTSVSVAYAFQNERDYAVLVAAVRSGRIEALVE